MIGKNFLKTTAILASVVFAGFFLTGGVTASEPAVSGINGKISGFGGGSNDKGLGGAVGSLTFPLGHSLGMQLDGAAALVDGDAFGAGGVHLFWRDPTLGMLGIFGSHSRLDNEGGVDVNRTALEGQVFMSRLTLDGVLGYRFGDVDETAYGKLNLDYYPQDDWLMSAGYAYDDDNFGSFKSEYQFASSDGIGVSLFGQGMVHDSDNYSLVGGIKLYIGSNHSLIDRHRREDPDVDFFMDMRAALLRAKESRQGRAKKSGANQGVGEGAMCTINGGGLVTSPANGACTCPAGSHLEGQQPQFIGNDLYSCARPPDVD